MQAGKFHMKLLTTIFQPLNQPIFTKSIQNDSCRAGKRTRNPQNVPNSILGKQPWKFHVRLA
jgi:hypothetical protein